MTEDLQTETNMRKRQDTGDLFKPLLTTADGSASFLGRPVSSPHAWLCLRKWNYKKFFWEWVLKTKEVIFITAQKEAECGSAKASPTRQKLSLLTEEKDITCVDFVDHWSNTGKNNLQPWLVHKSWFLSACLTVGERETGRVHLMPSNDFIWPGISDRKIRLYSTVYKQVGAL